MQQMLIYLVGPLLQLFSLIQRFGIEFLRLSCIPSAYHLPPGLLQSGRHRLPDEAEDLGG